MVPLANLDERARRLLAAGLLALVLAACGAEAPTWVPLTGGERGQVPLTDARLRIDPDGGSAWVDHPVGAWKRDAHEGLWTTTRPDGRGFLKSGEELALHAGRVSFTNRPEIHSLDTLAQLTTDGFASIGDLLYLSLPSGDEPPSGLVFSVRKRRVPGERPALGGWTGEGFPLWPGESMTFRCAIPAARVLRFHWSCEPLGEESTPCGLRVSVDGEPLANLEGLAARGGSGSWCRVALPTEGRSEAELRFELVGSSALALVLTPGIAPVEPDPSPSPDLVLFLADTLRADTLAYAGGVPELAPELNGIAAQSLRFLEARAPSTWTLPSQASMLSALYPEQHGAVSLGHALPDGLTTLPEWLARHGYRTGAVTDSAFVSRHYGLDQGFEYFLEFREWSLDGTLRAAREFLDADDGRPVFLFVQTYRTHMPYRTGPEEDRQALAAVVSTLRKGSVRHGGDGSVTPAIAGAALLELYHRGAQALDAGFGPWWRSIAARPQRATFLAFTSDHGEAFGEHGELGHGGPPWEEKIRVPLLLQGPGLRPRAVTHGASLVDLPATLCALAGLPAAPGWSGRSLLDLDVDRPIYSFVRIGEDPMVAIVDGSRKLYGPADPERLVHGELRGATDLADDPGETNDLAHSAEWPAALARAQAGAIHALVQAAASARAVELSGDERAFLHDIGYD